MIMPGPTFLMKNVSHIGSGLLNRSENTRRKSKQNTQNVKNPIKY